MRARRKQTQTRVRLSWVYVSNSGLKTLTNQHHAHHPSLLNADTNPNPTSTCGAHPRRVVTGEPASRPGEPLTKMYAFKNKFYYIYAYYMLLFSWIRMYTLNNKSTSQASAWKTPTHTHHEHEHVPCARAVRAPSRVNAYAYAWLIARQKTSKLGPSPTKPD